LVSVATSSFSQKVVNDYAFEVRSGTKAYTQKASLIQITKKIFNGSLKEHKCCGHRYVIVGPFLIKDKTVTVSIKACTEERIPV